MWLVRRGICYMLKIAITLKTITLVIVKERKMWSFIRWTSWRREKVMEACCSRHQSPSCSLSIEMCTYIYHKYMHIYVHLMSSSDEWCILCPVWKYVLSLLSAACRCMTISFACVWISNITFFKKFKLYNLLLSPHFLFAVEGN